MKLQKRLSIILVCITLISLVLSFVLNILKLEFYKDICIGIFTGGMLSFIITIVSFNYEKADLLRKLYFGCLELAEAIGEIRYCKNIHQDVEIARLFKNVEIVYDKCIFDNLYLLKPIGKKSKTRIILTDIHKSTLDICGVFAKQNEIIDEYFLSEVQSTLNIDLDKLSLDLKECVHDFKTSFKKLAELIE